VGAQRLSEQFATLPGIRNWWTHFSERNELVGSLASFRLVEWECIDSKQPQNSGSSNLHNGMGTKIRLEMENRGEGKAELKFMDVELAPLECATVCSSLWLFHLNQGLRA
jgi:hypothetical protein